MNRQAPPAGEASGKRRICGTLASLLCLLFLCIACAESEESLTRAEHLGPSLRKALVETLQETAVPDAVLGVRFEDGSLWMGAEGLARLGESPEPMRSDLHFRMGSITKTFTGTAILMLVGEGVLSLEDKVETWLPGLIPGGDAITLRMLLEHSSGLYDFTWSEEGYIDPFLSDLNRVWTPGELVDLAVSEGPLSPPGAVGVYSNTNTILLGMVLEAASGQEAECFLEDRIIKPLGLKGTTFPRDAELPPPYAAGYLDLNGDGVFLPEEETTRQHPSSIWTAGALVSTPGDLLLWLDELLSGTLLTPELQAERLAFDRPIEGYPSGRFGLGIALLDGGIGHTGAVPGYQSIVMRYRQTGFVVWSNGYLTGEGAVNAANRIYAAAVKVVYPDADPSL